MVFPCSDGICPEKVGDCKRIGVGDCSRSCQGELGRFWAVQGIHVMYRDY